MGVDDVKAGAKMGEDFVLQLAASKMSMEVGAGEALGDGDVGFWDVVCWDDGRLG
jgi:hypothetical protein